MALIRRRSFAPFHLQLQMQVLCHHLQTQMLLWIHHHLQMQMQLLGICHHLKLVWISWKFRTAKLWEDAKCWGAQDGQKFIITEYTPL
jgi:hypothetical protein